MNNFIAGTGGNKKPIKKAQATTNSDSSSNTGSNISKQITQVTNELNELNSSKQTTDTDTESEVNDEIEHEQESESGSESDGSESEESDAEVESESDKSSQFKEKVMKFVKVDNLLREKTKKVKKLLDEIVELEQLKDDVKELKEQRKPLEEFILDYLDKNNATHVNLKDGKLTMSKTKSNSDLKLDLIKESINEGINQKNLTTPQDITEKIIELIDAKRTIKTSLRRSFTKADKTNKEPKKDK